jgi:hypothetical protein
MAHEPDRFQAIKHLNHPRKRRDGADAFTAEAFLWSFIPGRDRPSHQTPGRGGGNRAPLVEIVRPPAVD